MLIIIWLLVLIFSINTPVWAGGAAARTKQQGAAMQQRQLIQRRQQQLIRQKAIEQKRLELETEIYRPQEPSQPSRLPQSTQPSPEVLESEVEDVIDITDLWASLDKSSEAWPLIIDREAKVATVERYIQVYRNNGIAINRPPMHYVNLIDSMSRESPEMLDNPFQQVLQIVAIIEYDFDNGQNKDAMARQVLGEQGFIENRRRLGLP